MSFLKEAEVHITQGSIVDGVKWGLGDVEPLGIVLSNPCDLEHGKASFFIVAALLAADETIKISKEYKDKTVSANSNNGLSSKAWTSFRKYLTEFIHNKNIVRYYFIDTADGIIDAPPLFVDFQLIKSIPIDTPIDNVAQLPAPYVQQMIMHFVAYTSRIGVDRVDEFQEMKLVNELANPFYKSM